VLIVEQQCVFDQMCKSLEGIHFLEGTRESRKSFLIKYFTNYLKGLRKKVLLFGTIVAAMRQLSSTTTIVHTHFKIPICSYLYTLHQPNVTLQRLEEANVFIIDKMSMMTRNVLNAI